MPGFDFIIIGGGSAGCVLANRLSASGEFSVCLLEAGPSDNNYWVRDTNPLNMLYLFNSQRYNWHYQASSSPGNQAISNPGNHISAQGNSEREYYWPRGKCLGGSSSINAMIYTRGHPADFDHWAASLGDSPQAQGWSYQQLLPLFKKSQRQLRPKQNFGDEKDVAFHGFDGEMTTTDSNYHFPPSTAFVNACAEAGFSIRDDFNGSEQQGCGFFQLTQTAEGKRANASTSFLDPARKRKNLTVITQAQTSRLLFRASRSGQKPEAYGVEYIDLSCAQKTRKRLYAEREVILSAGVINSPQILMLSGIGPSEQLKQHQIEPVKILPGVGENLQDHPDILLRYRDTSNTSFASKPTRQMWDFIKKRFIADSNKAAVIFTPTDCGGFIKSDSSQEIPDLQLQFAAVRMRPHGAGITSSMQCGFVLHICHLRPQSRGRITLNSSNPLDKPQIDANYFDSPQNTESNESSTRELKALVNGVKIARNILAQPAMQPFGQLEEVPGAQIQSDAELEDFIRKNIETVYHTAGSCKMGQDPVKDKAVVDGQLKVHGVGGLRVIDSSIMPTITGSNIHAPTVMIAEKGAEMILAEHSNE